MASKTIELPVSLPSETCYRVLDTVGGHMKGWRKVEADETKQVLKWIHSPGLAVFKINALLAPLGSGETCVTITAENTARTDPAGTLERLAMGLARNLVSVASMISSDNPSERHGVPGGDRQPLSKTGHVRRSLASLEAIEFAWLGAALGLFMGVLFFFTSASSPTFVDYPIWARMLEAQFLAYLTMLAPIVLWGIYAGYIRLARDMGLGADIFIWVILASITATVSAWCWITLDINRYIISKLFLKSEAPVEYAWSFRSKQRRAAWEEAKQESAAHRLIAQSLLPNAGPGLSRAG